MFNSYHVENSVSTILTNLKINNCPIDTNKIAELLNISVIYLVLEKEFRGYYRKNGFSEIIAININYSKLEQKFILANLIGHKVLHDNKYFHINKNPLGLKYDKTKNKLNDLNIEEIEANRFASRLLVPTFAIVKDLNSLDILDENSVNKLAKEKYEVSTMVLIYRLFNLGYEIF